MNMQKSSHEMIIQNQTINDDNDVDDDDNDDGGGDV